MGNLCCPPAAPSPVVVHIYDVTGTAAFKVFNEIMRPFGTGAFHAAVEVHGTEWSFGQSRWGHGIVQSSPRECELHSYRESIHMGYTDLSPFEVEMVIAHMTTRWRGRDYNVFHKNCCHFADELCQLLGVGELPEWTNNLAAAASRVGPGQVCHGGASTGIRFAWQPFGITRIRSTQVAACVKVDVYRKAAPEDIDVKCFAFCKEACRCIAAENPWRLPEVPLAKIAVTVAREIRFLSMAQQEVIRQETLGVQKKKGVESRYFVLSKESLDYFSTEAESHESSEPRGRMDLKEVEKLEAQEDGFSLILRGGQSLNLKTPEDSLELWLSSLRPLIKASGGKFKGRVLCSGYLSVERKGLVKKPFFVLRENSLERYDTAAHFEKGQEPRAMPLTDIERVTVGDRRLTLEVKDQKKPLEFQVDSTKEFLQWQGALEKLLAQRLGDNFVSSAEAGMGHASASVRGETMPREAPKLLCEGELLVLKSDREDPRYCVLRTDCFQYFNSREDYQTGVAARARALIEDVTSFEVLEDGTMEVELGAKKWSFKAHNTEDLHRWQTAWETDPEEPLPVSGKPLPVPKPPVVTSGGFNLRKEGLRQAASFGLLVLREDRLEFFEGRGRVPSEDEAPDVSALMDEIEDLEVKEDVLTVRLADPSKTFELFSPQGKTMEEWHRELEHVFEETPSSAEDEDPKATVSTDDSTAQIARELLNFVKTVNTTFRACMVNGQTAQNALDLHTALRQNTQQVKPEDLAKALKDLGIGLTGAQIEYFMLSLDPTDGGVTWEEWLKALSVTEADPASAASKVRDRYQEGGVLRRVGPAQQEICQAVEKPEEKPSSPSRATRNRSLFSGPVELGGDRRHGVLYADRLAFFENSEDIVYADPDTTVQLREMQAVKASNGVFEIQATSGLLEMRCRRAFELWQSSLSEALGASFTKHVKGKTIEWVNIRGPTDSPVRLPKPGASAKPMHQGPLRLLQEDGSEQMRYVLVYGDRFEHFNDAVSALRGSGSSGVVHATDVTSVRVTESAFIFKLRQESLHVQVPVGEDMELWVSAFQLLFHPQNDAGHSPPNMDELLVLYKHGAFLKGGERSKMERSELAAEVQDERFQNWLQALPEKVIHWGLLGFQHQQRLVVRLSILFRDRLDSWCSASSASCGMKEDSRILMSRVRGLETISGGLIVDLGGKKVGIHVGDNENLQQWSGAFLSVLAPLKTERSVSPGTPADRPRSQPPSPGKGRDRLPVAYSTKSTPSSPSQMPRKLKESFGFLRPMYQDHGPKFDEQGFSAKIGDELLAFKLDRTCPLTPISIAELSEESGPAKAAGVQPGWYLDLPKTFSGPSREALSKVIGMIGGVKLEGKDTKQIMEAVMGNLEEFTEVLNSKVILWFISGSAAIAPVLLPEGELKLSSELSVLGTDSKKVILKSVCSSGPAQAREIWDVIVMSGLWLKRVLSDGKTKLILISVFALQPQLFAMDKEEAAERLKRQFRKLDTNRLNPEHQSSTYTGYVG
ncbi:Desumoylating isopeptidase 2 [Symbiodinium microadriaticum]|uniref:Desumoylating isopeptidase 2 n=1 Tax=Symbiodinium microadriaticum TaxID=2951 RepID=A0A1Q9EHJ4_SYMMI|nr:Desumoylating isopeptidase 2 [Symbiodinium microadriaticum]